MVFSIAALDGSGNEFLSNPGGANVDPSLAGSTNTIKNMYSTNNATTANSSSSIELPTSNPQSYSAAINLPPTGSKTQAYGFVPFNTEAIVSPTGSSLALYEVTPSVTTGRGSNSHTTPASSTDLGTFTLGGNGTLQYTAASVPEPSTYALMGLAGLTLLFVRRRSMQS